MKTVRQRLELLIANKNIKHDKWIVVREENDDSNNGIYLSDLVNGLETIDNCFKQYELNRKCTIYKVWKDSVLIAYDGKENQDAGWYYDKYS